MIASTARHRNAEHLALSAVVVLLSLVALILLVGVGLYASGEPGLLQACLAAFAVVSLPLKVAVPLLAPARAFDDRPASLAASSN